MHECGGLLYPLPAAARCICDSSCLQWLLWKHLALFSRPFIWLVVYHLSSDVMLSGDSGGLSEHEVHTKVTCPVSAISPRD